MTVTVSRMFATCLPGLAPLVRQQLDQLPGIRVTGSGFDGRADVVLFQADHGRRESAMTLRITEDVFVAVGHADRAGSDNPRRIAAALWRPRPVQRALSIWAGHRRPLAGAMTFRVVTRVLSEKAFIRTELRQRLTATIRQSRPRWAIADPAQLEIWACEYRRGRFISGLRLSDASMRQHGGRNLQRPGALRPTLAAAMVRLAGQPPGVLLDPCCGSGTIRAEATAAGWTATGTDIDPAAVAIAHANAPQATVRVADALHMHMPEASVTACVTNLPFGRQYRFPGEMKAWLSAVLREVERVTRPDGHAVLLAPALPRPIVPSSLKPADAFPVRLLGTKTTIWCYQRAARSAECQQPGR